ncbi:MAG: ChbG/HpnK family deacetylase [Elusimicrobia bacterium]|nr:ChbG/HpnK family deacetylase [Elusimicrobiota bacterium]
MSPKSLIVTADDFGYSSSVNRAVVEAFRHGILRFASLMVLRPAAREAAALAKEYPGLGVGLHLELCADQPEKAGLRYFFDAKARAGVEGEIRAQFDALLALGVTPTHVDGHINIHVHPVVFPALCRVAREYGVPRVRLPSGELSASLDYPGDADPVLPRLALAGTFAAMRAWIRPAAAGLTVPRTWGLLRSGRMTEEYAVWLLGRLPDGLTELYFHPCADPASEAPADGPTPTHQTVTELRTLTSARVRAALDASGAALAEKSFS